AVRAVGGCLAHPLKGSSRWYLLEFMKLACSLLRSSSLRALFSCSLFGRFFRSLLSSLFCSCFLGSFFRCLLAGGLRLGFYLLSEYLFMNQAFWLNAQPGHQSNAVQEIWSIACGDAARWARGLFLHSMPLLRGWRC